MTDPEFENVMRRQIDHVLRLACSYLRCRAEAEDIAQEVFLKLYRTDISFETPKDERAWLLTVTANLCKNRLRSPWFARRCDETPEDICGNFPEEEKSAVSEVYRLPEKYRTPIHLFYIEEYSVKEISEITGINDEVFIPAAKRAMTFKEKIYGIPIYTDAMASFEKYGSSSGETVYLEKDASDMAAHIRCGINSGLSLSDAHRAYADASKCAAVGEFINSDAGKLRAWVSRLDDIQKSYPKAAVNMKIKLENNALVRTKLAVINNESRSYSKSLKLIEYLLSDDSQRKIMSGMPGVPVMKKNYSDVFTADRITYIENIDGENFCTFPFSVNFYENELSLTEAAENNASYSETERLLEYMANP